MARTKARIQHDSRHREAKGQPHESSPSTRVLCLVELLEPILADLPMQDLLLAQRVCQTWQSTIQNSRRLQEALYFVAVAHPQHVHCSASSVCAIRNPMLDHIFNPHLPISNGFRTKRKIKQAAYSLPNASWRRMLVTQPPINELTLSRHSLYQGVSFRYTYFLNNTRPTDYGVDPRLRWIAANPQGLRAADVMPKFRFGHKSPLDHVGVKLYFHASPAKDSSAVALYSQLDAVYERSLRLTRVQAEGRPPLE